MLPVDKGLLIRTRKKFLPKKSCLTERESQSVERTNLQLFLLDPSLINSIRIRKSKILLYVKTGQPKIKKKPPAVVARDRARRKEYWKRMKVARQLRAENLSLHYLLQETQTVASPQVPVVRHQEKSGSLERTSAVSLSYQLQDTETVASP